jgi:N-acyl-L-homoserine lactone synthetase
MIHIVTANNRHLYRAQLKEMHELRRVFFVEERGWKDLTVIDGGEYDQFDDERTVYVLAMGPGLKIMGGMRMRPTEDKSMLNDIFPDLIGPDRSPIRDRVTWEIGRSFATREARKITKTTGRSFAIDILLGGMEWLEQAGVERIIGIVELPLFATCRSWGWNCLMTGLPLDTPDGPIVGLEAANTAADVEAFRRLNGHTSRISIEVTDDDMAAFGSLEAIEAELAVVRSDVRNQAQSSADRSI